jgi:hypothetical protein
MESDIVQCRRKKWINNFEGLDGSIQVLIVDGVLVVPNSGIWPRHFVTDEENAVVSRRGLDLVYRRTGPSSNAGLLSHGGAHASKTKGLVDSGHAVLTVRSVVIHVALVRMTLAPDAFVGDDVIRFGKIRRPRIERRVQVVNVNQNSVRRYVMTVAAVIVRCIT